MNLSEAQIESLAPNPAAYSAGKKLSAKEQWVSYAGNERVIWGSIKGSGKSPYLTQIDKAAVAYKCTCPSRQFPCKHSIGLLLLHTQHNSSFEKSDEPEWVKEWMDKRVAKEQQKKDEPPERTSEEQEQLEKNKEKTQANRLTSVMAGVAELELWLKDMVRIGFLELPNKSKSEFDKVAARMVDAKAPGLAGWVKAYTRLNYGNALEWQQEAMSITARLFLLVRTLKNYEQLNPVWQHTVRNLSGWSQSTKELLADADAEVVTDQWLVVGQETETSDDEITIQRNWLLGFTTGRTALILNFGTKFSALENNVLPGTFIDADLAFFPSVLPQRAAVKMQRKLLTMLSTIPVAISSWTEALHYRTAKLKINPWANDIILLLSNARLIKSDDYWVVCDEHKFSIPIITEFDFQKIMKWVALTGNRSLPMAVVMRDKKVIPLGIIDEQAYKLL